MIFLFEQFSYDPSYLKEIFPETFFSGNTKSFVSGDGRRLDCVGFYYGNGKSVFILPRVLVRKDENGCFWAIERNFLISSKNKLAESSEREKDFFTDENHEDRSTSDNSVKRVKFLNDLSEWLFSAMSLYRSKNKSKSAQDVVAPRVKEFREGSDPTLNDVIRSMRKFYRENQNLFALIHKNKHSGNGLINWQKTISKRLPFLQKRFPVYVDPIVKAKVFDLDERLIVLYFSAMNYIQQKFNFKMPKSEFYSPLRASEVEQLMGGRGLRELRSIKHKYFADKFLKLYNIMVGFFRWAGTFYANGCDNDYLLTNKFNNVFEDIIDNLIGDELPEDRKYIKAQKDGRRIDHVYQQEGLLFAHKDNCEDVYFIGDSKYYRSDRTIKIRDLAKQFDYAKNIIQYSVFDSFANPRQNEDEIREKQDFFYRDDLTEGYNVTPNFFIRGSAYANEDERDENESDSKASGLYSFYDDDIYKVGNNVKFRRDRSASEDEETLDDDDGLTLWDMRNRHYVNRLFDRDTLLLQVYNVNFLFVLRMYTSNDSTAQDAFKSKARDAFRINFVRYLDEKYVFWVLMPQDNLGTECELNLAKAVLKKDDGSEIDAPDNLKLFMWKHSRVLAGKVFRPKDFDNCLILALERDFAKLDDSASFWVSFESDCKLIVPVKPREIWDGKFAVQLQEEFFKGSEDVLAGLNDGEYSIEELEKNARC